MYTARRLERAGPYLTLAKSIFLALRAQLPLRAGLNHTITVAVADAASLAALHAGPRKSTNLPSQVAADDVVRQSRRNVPPCTRDGLEQHGRNEDCDVH